MNNDSYTGVQKAAILLITLGPEKAATIFKHLKEDEIEELTLEIANTRSVSPQTKEEVLEEFYQVCLAQQYIAEGGIGYAKELLEKALGNDKAQGVIAKLTASLQVRPFEFIRKTDPAQLLNFIQDEHPQTIAMILSYLAPAQASQVLGALPPEKQADVAKRIATMDRTSPDVIKEVERVLERKLASLVNQDYTIVGGIDAIVGILNSVDRGTRTFNPCASVVHSASTSSFVFSFEKLINVDNHLGPEMKSTGEVLGVAGTLEEALYKGLIGAGYKMKKKGGVFITVRNSDKAEIGEIAKKYYDLGFRIYATEGTADVLKKYGIDAVSVKKIHESKTNNTLTLIESGKIQYVISTSAKGRIPSRDSVKIRRKTVERNIPWS